ncbi:hypothetical protein LINPERHAP1_LOCUS24304, partial [Linum perenne]
MLYIAVNIAHYKITTTSQLWVLDNTLDVNVQLLLSFKVRETKEIGAIELFPWKCGRTKR